MTLDSQEPGPIVIQSASVIAAKASGVALGVSGISRNSFTLPTAAVT